MLTIKHPQTPSKVYIIKAFTTPFNVLAATSSAFTTPSITFTTQHPVRLLHLPLRSLRNIQCVYYTFHYVHCATPSAFTTSSITFTVQHPVCLLHLPLCSLRNIRCVYYTFHYVHCATSSAFTTPSITFTALSNEFTVASMFRVGRNSAA